MSYQPKTWENKPSTASPINATNLNHMEGGIKTNDDNIVDAQNAILVLQSSVIQNDADINNIEGQIEVSVGEDVAKIARWEKGTLINGIETESTARIRTDYIDVTNYEDISVSIRAGYKYAGHVYDTSKNFIYNIGDWSTVDTVLTFAAEAKYIRFIVAKTTDAQINLETLHNIDAFGRYSIAKTVSTFEKEKKGFLNVDEDVSLGSWSIGWVYAAGGVATAAEMPQYVCTQALQKFPFGVTITPDSGFQYCVRFFDESDLSVTDAEGWTFEPFYIPANTPFSINVSKTTPENVQNINDYISAIHVRSYASNNITSPIKRKKTKIAVLGDSISTFSGISESGYWNPYYPTGDVTKERQMWWYIVADALGATDGISVSAISRTAYYDFGDASQPPVYDATRIARLGVGGDPDVIFINVGTNDGFAAQNANIAYTANVADLETLSNSTSKGIALTIRRIQSAYPYAKIVLLIPKQVKIADMPAGYDLERVMKIADEINAYAEMYGVYKVIDLRKCNINQDNIGQYCGDGNTHPNARGMRVMAQYILDELR